MVNGKRRLFVLFILGLFVLTMVTLSHFNILDPNFNGSQRKTMLVTNVDQLQSRQVVLYTKSSDNKSSSKRTQTKHNAQQLVDKDNNKGAIKVSKANVTSSSVIASKSQQDVNQVLYDSYQDSVSPLTTSEAVEVQSTPKKESNNNSWNLTKDMLQDTQTFLIAKDNYCDDLGVATDLIIMVTSAVNNLEQREAIRETWGQFAVERGALLLFVIGKSRNKTIQDAVLREELMNGDLLQAPFIDSYFNLTLKSLSMMRWIKDNCNKVKFVFKVDDDMFVNMQLLVDFSETRTFTKSIIGRIARKWAPQRRKTSKWFLPRSVYNRTLFPDFATGPAYMFTGDSAAPLLDESLKQTPIYLEDVYITGIVAEKAKIRRLNYSLMKNSKINVTPCSFRRFITSHQHTPKDIRRLWKLVYSNSTIDCSPTKSSVKVTRNKGS